jgi:phosphatidylglycerophosphatase A
MGTLGAIPLYWLAVREGGRIGVALAAILVTAVGVWAASVVQRDLRVEDPQVVVIDEVAGMLFTMIPVDGFSWRATAAGFALFRVLDIWKPWPIRRFEALPSGWGIVLDDVAAGLIGAGAILALRTVAAAP